MSKRQADHEDTSVSKRQKPDDIDIDSELFRTGKYSDFTIKRDHSSWAVHSFIVCSRSAFFAKAYAERDMGDNSVTLEVGHPRTIQAMLKWIYTGQYVKERFDGGESYLTLREHSQVFNVSKMYNLPDLSRLATEEFAASAVFEWRNWSFAKLVEQLFDSLADDSLKELRATVVDVCADNATEIFTLVGKEHGADAEDHFEIWRTVRTNALFAAALAAELAKRLQLAKG